MNLNHLHYFRVLAKTEHYTQAANQLDITQPSLSHAIAALEKDLGCYLFEKQGRNIKLTKYGRIFYEYIDKGLQEVDLGERRLRELTSQENGWIDLAFIYTLGSHYVPHLLQSFLAQSQNRKIKFSLKQHHRDSAGAEGGKVRCGLLFLRGQSAGYQFSADCTGGGCRYCFAQPSSGSA